MPDLQLQAQIDELFLLQRVAQRISALLDIDALLHEIVGDVAQTFGYSRSAVLLKDELANELVIAAVRGWTVNYHQKGERFKIGEYGIFGHVASTGETHYAPDVLLDPNYQVSEPLTRSELDIPLKRHGRLIESRVKENGVALVRKGYCGFPLTVRLGRALRARAYNSPPPVRLDALLSELTKFNLHYHRDMAFKKIPPIHAFYVFSKK